MRHTKNRDTTLIEPGRGGHLTAGSDPNANDVQREYAEIWNRTPRYVFSTTLERYPTLKIAFAESQIGWMPYVYERCDAIWKKGNTIAGISPLSSATGMKMPGGTLPR